MTKVRAMMSARGSVFPVRVRGSHPETRANGVPEERSLARARRGAQAVGGLTRIGSFLLFLKLIELPPFKVAHHEQSTSQHKGQVNKQYYLKTDPNRLVHP